MATMLPSVVRQGLPAVFSGDRENVCSMCVCHEKSQLKKSMKKIFAKILMVLSGLLWFPQTVSGQPACYSHIADSLSARLEVAGNAADSIRLLTDIIDLRPKTMRDSIGKMILHTALVSGDDRAGLDIIRNLANLHIRSDSLLAVDLKNALRFSPGYDRDETVTFVRMMQNLNKVRYASPDEKNRRVRQLLREISLGESGDIYDNIVTLHAICLYIGETSQGELLSKYLDRLGALVSELRPEAYSIRNSYLVHAALAYKENEEHQKSIDCDKALLKSIDNLENGIDGYGRRYRTYDGNRYIIYTRLLSNYPRLESAEVEKIYRNAMLMVSRDSLAANSNRISMRPQIYYAMFKHDYAHALELLKTYVDYPYNAHAKRLLLKMMIKSAEEVGDIDALLTASRNYNEILEKTLDERTQEKYKELQIVYDVNQMKADHAREAVRMQRVVMVIAIVAAVILLLFLIVTFVLWMHSRKLARDLIHANDALTAESANLRQAQADLVKARDDARLANRIKSDFIKNMSGEVAVPLHTINEYTNLIIDCSEAGFKPYLKHFADLVLLNSELLTSIVNDVLNLAEIDSDSVAISMKKESLLKLCETAVDSVKHRARPGVRMEVAEGLTDVMVYTDPRRLLQIMVQLLSNAAKFTKDGRVLVSFDTDKEGINAVVSVTDTGIGVAPENAERIFERFVKLDRSSQGVGIGLPIARHLAELLAGTVYLDTAYTDGARFIVTVPLG